jgi:hypothetical protein
MRGDDIDVVSPSSSFTREEMDVLADAAEMRIVVLRNKGDTERAVIPNHRQMR